ncbi:MAG: membrane protein insertion efficiency factor YidD [bacterium]
MTKGAKWSRNIAIYLIKIYQVFISPLKFNCCRYYPSCSNYAIGAINKYGIFKGGYLSLKRLLKCNPLFPGGIDPV